MLLLSAFRRRLRRTRLAAAVGLLLTPSPAPAVELDSTTLWTGPTMNVKLTSSSQDPIVRHGPYVFFLFVDDKRRPVLGRHDTRDGTTGSTFLSSDRSYRTRDDGHHAYSIGVDHRHRVHVIGDMHDHPFR